MELDVEARTEAQAAGAEERRCTADVAPGTALEPAKMLREDPGVSVVLRITVVDEVVDGGATISVVAEGVAAIECMAGILIGGGPEPGPEGQAQAPPSLCKCKCRCGRGSCKGSEATGTDSRGEDEGG